MRIDESTSIRRWWRKRVLPNWLRVIALILVPVEFAASLPMMVWAEIPATNAPPTRAAQPTGVGQRGVYNPPLVRTPTNIVTQAPVKLAPVSLTPSFSDPPTDAEIGRTHFLDQALCPIGGKTTAKENEALVKSLEAYHGRAENDDVSALTGFLARYPRSAWRASLLTNLGIIYRYTGYFSRAMDAWEEAWQISMDETDPGPRAVADRAVGELAQINAWVGRYERLDPLLDEVQHRAIRGASVDKLQDAREGLWMMHNKPGVSFKCGPYALARVEAEQHPEWPADPKVQAARSSTNGMSLAQVWSLSGGVKTNYQMAKRAPGAKVIVPSLVNWKIGHYGALLKERGDHLLLEDDTFASTYGRQIWISKKALDEESSGYFLVAAGPLPEGWQSVGLQEGATVWGRGAPDVITPCHSSCCPHNGGNGGNGGKGGNGGIGGGCSGGCAASANSSSVSPMAQYDVATSEASLHIFDTPVGYQPPRGMSVGFAVSYNERDSDPSDQIFDFTQTNAPCSNLGVDWTFNWLSYVNTNDLSDGGSVTVYAPGGGGDEFDNFDSGSGTFSPQYLTGAHLAVVGPANNYVETKSDGTQLVYTNSDGNGDLFLSMMIDAQGNTNSLAYDSTNGVLRVRLLIDALGQTNEVDYGWAADVAKITKVTDPFGRYATFSYDSTNRLIAITDVIGITSQFTYDDANSRPDFISALTTPYGTTIFVDEDSGNNQALEVIDPLGQHERWEADPAASGLFPPVEPPSMVPDATRISVDNGYADDDGLDDANTFYWDKAASANHVTAPNGEGYWDYDKAHIFHWLVTSNNHQVVSGVLDSEKAPLENRIWYAYPGQTAPGSLSGVTVQRPSGIARVLDDGSTQLYSNEYNNAYGKVTKKIDPLGRATTYIYTNNDLDLYQVRQTTGTNNDLLATYIYNSQHLVITNIDASGQTNSYTYNRYGQRLTSINALSETNSYAYSNSYLVATIDPTGTTNMTYTYDLFGRVQTSTDSQGYTVTIDYDNANRPTVITYPDGTYEQMVYNNLDLAAMRDRLGRWTRKFYDPLRRVVAIVDPLWRVTQFQYCTCGALENLIDPLQHTTSWSHDLEGRVTAKTYEDGTSVQYTYENTTSRLKSMTDAKGQTTFYTNNLDNTLAGINYSNAVVFTAPVTFTYDTNYNRIVCMVDTNGTTTYSYNPATNTVLGAGKLASVVVPLSTRSATITYGYDPLGRMLNRGINGVTNALHYDSLGRVMIVSNVLGVFTNTYIGVTPRLSTMTYPNGQLLTNTYFGNTGDEQLQEIWNQGSGGSTISKFDYMYDAEGEIQSWTQQTNSAPSSVYNYQHDAAGQLVEGLQSGASVSTNEYAYDAAGNRLSERINAVVEGAAYNSVNELTNRSGRGPLRFRGSVNEPISNVTVAGNTATIDSETNFTGYATVGAGINTVQVQVADFNGNTAAHYYTVVLSNGTAQSLGYDLNGNLTNITSGSTVTNFQWDAANRLTAITEISGTTTNQSLFGYDGLGRRVRQTEVSGTTTNSDNWMLWCGTELCEKRDSTGGVVSNRFFAQGEQMGGANYYFTRDHLGSVREMTDSNRMARAEYTYDPWGRRTRIGGNGPDADFGFTGHYYHAPSGLDLTLYRAYGADLGRWLSRDPLENAELLPEGPNLFAYIMDDPLDGIDADGLSRSSCLAAIARFWQASARLAARIAEAAYHGCTKGNPTDPNHAGSIQQAMNQVSEAYQDVLRHCSTLAWAAAEIAVIGAVFQNVMSNAEDILPQLQQCCAAL